VRSEAVGRHPSRAPVYAAELVAGKRRSLARVVACGREPLLGRGWLNRLRVTLDEPALTLFLQAPTHKARADSPPWALTGLADLLQVNLDAQWVWSTAWGYPSSPR
jgi:hypothetical protein